MSTAIPQQGTGERNESEMIEPVLVIADEQGAALRQSSRGRPVLRGGESSNNTGSMSCYISSVIVQITGKTPDFGFLDCFAIPGSPQPSVAGEMSNALSILPNTPFEIISKHFDERRTQGFAEI